MPIQRVKGKSLSGKLGASGINLADTFAFTGTVTGTGMDLVSSSSTTSSGLSALEIDLPTTTDFVALKLILYDLYGLHGEGPTTLLADVANDVEKGHVVGVVVVGLARDRALCRRRRQVRAEEREG